MGAVARIPCHWGAFDARGACAGALATWSTVKEQHSLISAPMFETQSVIAATDSNGPFGMTITQPLKCTTCHGSGFRYVPFDCIPANRIPETLVEDCPTCEGTGRSKREPTVDLQVFQHSAGQVMGVFRMHDPRPNKASLYSTAMPIDEALSCARQVARSKSVELVIDDPHGRMTGQA